MRLSIVRIGRHIQEPRQIEEEILTCGFANCRKHEKAMCARFGFSRCTQSHFSCILGAAGDTTKRRGPHLGASQGIAAQHADRINAAIDRRINPTSLRDLERRCRRFRSSEDMKYVRLASTSPQPAPHTQGGAAVRPPLPTNRTRVPAARLCAYASTSTPSTLGLTRRSAPTASSGSSTCCGST